jgi:hypothetical protein
MHILAANSRIHPGNLPRSYKYVQSRDRATAFPIARAFYFAVRDAEVTNG